MQVNKNMSKENGKFEQAMANIVNDSNPWCPTKRPHRDVIGRAAIIERYMGPGYVEASQLEGEELFKPVQITESVKVSAPGMNKGFDGKK